MSIATSTLLEDFFPQSYALIAGSALIFFDYVITVGQEVQLFWNERSFSAWLFFANRMLALVYASLSVWSIIIFYTVTSCTAMFMAINLIGILISLISDVVVILGVYAVTGGDRRPVILLALLVVFNVASNAYTDFGHTSYSVVILSETVTCTVSYTSNSAQNIASILGTANDVCLIALSSMTLAILWRKLYVHHRAVIADLLSTRNPSFAALVFRDGTIPLIAYLLLDVLLTILDFMNLNATNVVANLQTALLPVLLSRVLLNFRAAARSQRGLETEEDVGDMSFELNILNSTEQAPESARPQDSIEHDQHIAEPQNMADNIVTASDAHRNMDEAEGMHGVEQEMPSDWEDDE